MVARGYRVLDLRTGCGAGALVAASRGAAVVACDPDSAAVACADANLRAADLRDRVDLRAGGLDAIAADEGPFDLVWWRGRQDPSGYAALSRLLERAPDLLGEGGRLILPIDRTTGAEELVRSRVPDGFRVVRLARSPGLIPTWEALSLGWDVEAARARRHAERDRSAADKAAVSRKRWDGANQPPPSSEEVV